MPLMDLSSTVSNFFTGTYNVTRSDGPGTYDQGEFVPSTTSVVPVPAAVMPLVGRDLERFVEGRKTGERRQVFTLVELYVEAPARKPDIMSIDGATWEVESVEPWQNLGNFYRVIVRKEPS